MTCWRTRARFNLVAFVVVEDLDGLGDLGDLVGSQRTWSRIDQVLSWANMRLQGPRSRAWRRLYSFCHSGLPRPLIGVATRSWSSPS